MVERQGRTALLCSRKNCASVSVVLPLHIATNPPFRDCQFYRTKCVIVHGGGFSLNEESGPESSACWPAPRGQPWESRILTSPCKLSFPYFNDHHNLLLPHTPLDVSSVCNCQGSPSGLCFRIGFCTHDRVRAFRNAWLGLTSLVSFPDLYYVIHVINFTFFSLSKVVVVV